jgi:energy-coupling factor transporter ATP-binding protein EcfA2
MKLTFSNQYKSIQNFNEIEVSDFCVFVGKNGSGKTHILKAIENGHIVVSGIQKEKVTYFNFQSFLISNQKAITARSLEDEKENAWNLVIQFKTQNLANNEVAIRQHIKNHTQNNPKLECLIETGLFLSKVGLSEIDKNTFLQYSEYTPDDYELLNSLSEICFDYHKKYIISGLPTEHGGKGKSSEELIEIESKSPWYFINEMFETFGLPHKVKAPKFNAGEIIGSGNIEYQAKPVYEGLEIGFDDLSSGERILCALAITVFQDQQNTNFPELLLLDEVDASLHPSMVKNLLSVIREVFLKNNCKVILATHSPTTASLVDESEIFEVKKGKIQDKIGKISQTEAVDILSEGMMNLEKGLTLFDQISSKPISIITEGDNITHLEKAIRILEPTLLEKIDFLKGVEGSSGKDQLKTLFEFFKLVPHTNSVLFVLDCDVSTTSKVEVGKTFIFSLSKNDSNTIAVKGIENIYSENLFTDFLETKIDSQGNQKTSFDLRRKKDLLVKVLSCTEKTDFTNYQSLIDKIKTIPVS